MSSNSPLLSLPGELRNEVYKLTLAGTTMEVNIDKLGKAEQKFGVHAIRQTCKEIRAETEGLPTAEIDTVVIKPHLVKTCYGGKLPTRLFDLASWLAASGAHPLTWSLNVTLRIGEVNIVNVRDGSGWKEEIGRMFKVIPLEAITDPNIHFMVELTLLMGPIEPIHLLFPMNGSTGRSGDDRAALQEVVDAAIPPRKGNASNATTGGWQGFSVVEGVGERAKLMAAVHLMRYKLPWQLSAIYEIVENVAKGLGRKTNNDLWVEWMREKRMHEDT